MSRIRIMGKIFQSDTDLRRQAEMTGFGFYKVVGKG